MRVEEDGVVLYKHQDNVFFDFATLIEDGSKFSNQNCTISVLAKCNTLGVLISTVHQGTETVILNKVITGDSTKFEIYAYTFQVPVLAFGDYLKIAFRHRQSTSKSEQPKIQKAMLECGEIGTLENWHGDYAKTLCQCQRYLVPLSGYGIQLSAFLYQPNVVLVTVPIPVEMRILPSIATNPFMLTINDSVPIIKDCVVGKMRNNMLQVVLNLEEPVTEIVTRILCAINNDAIGALLSAEL